MAEPPPSTLTRRALPGSAAALTTVASATDTSGGRIATPTVPTWNVYLGVDLFRLFRAASVEEARRVAPVERKSTHRGTVGRDGYREPELPRVRPDRDHAGRP